MFISNAALTRYLTRDDVCPLPVRCLAGQAGASVYATAGRKASAMKLVSNIFPRLLPLAVVLAVSTVWSEPPRAEVNTKLPDYVIKEFGMPPAIPEGPLPEVLQSAVNTAFIEAMKQRN